MSLKGRVLIGRGVVMLALFAGLIQVFPYQSASARPLKQVALPANLSARAAIVIDYPAGHVLFDKSANTTLAPASTTKIVTALLALELGKPDDVITIQPRDLVPGTSMGLQAGEKQTLRNLLYGMLLPSGNDAAMAIARYIGSRPNLPVKSTAKDPVTRFVDLMNARAAQLHLTGSHFANPHGLDAPNHYMSAYDLACFTYLAMKYPLFNDIVRQETYQVPGHSLRNLNKMLAQYPGADGGKTGFTDNAGLCLVTTATRDGQRLISVVLNAPKWIADSTALLDYGFARLGVVQTKKGAFTVSGAPAWADLSVAAPASTPAPPASPTSTAAPRPAERASALTGSHPIRWKYYFATAI